MNTCDNCGKDFPDHDMYDLGGDRPTESGLVAYPAVCNKCHEEYMAANGQKRTLTAHWNGEIPVPDEVIREWRDKGVRRVRIEFTFPLVDLIEDTYGVEDLNETVDEIIGISLCDVSYGLAAPASGDRLNDTTLLLYVEGEIDETSLFYALPEER